MKNSWEFIVELNVSSISKKKKKLQELKQNIEYALLAI